MNAAVQLLLIASLSGTPVTVTTLDGDSIEGELLSLNSRQVVVQGEVEEQSIAVDQLMLLQLTETDANSKSATHTVTLSDQSSLGFESIKFSEKNATIQTSLLGEQTISTSEIRNIRWGPLDDKIAESWGDLENRGARDDLLVFRKGDVLDYVAGSVSNVGEKGVTISVRGRDLTAPLERVFAVVFTNRSEKDRPGLGLVRTTGGDILKAKSLALEENILQISMASGIEASIDLSKIREIDFGGGRIRFLADLPFDESTSVSPDPDFPVVWFTARNFPAGTGGRRRLTIDGEQYQRGLWLHSGAVVRFRLNRQFSEFRTLAGFDQTHVGNMPRIKPKVKLVILGDGEELYAREFLWSDSPEKVKLDMSKVRELIIRVESLGVGKGILEHFALGDAQVIQ